MTGSVAFDTLMRFPGRFGDHILADRVDDINVSFLVDDLVRRRGGTAANVALTLALLGERPALCAAVGTDFDAAAADLAGLGVDITPCLRLEAVPTASCYITTDVAGRQITAFHPGAMAHAAAIDLRSVVDVDTVVVTPDAPEAMTVHVAQAAALGARLVFAPAQQLPALDDATLRSGIEAAWLVAGNAYEWGLLERRVGVTPATVAAAGALAAVTRGADGATLHRDATVETIPAAPPDAMVDPTGGGDAWLAGLIAALRRGHDLAVAGRVAALAATFCIEQPGPQQHRYTDAGFRARWAAVHGRPLPEVPTPV